MSGKHAPYIIVSVIHDRKLNNHGITHIETSRRIVMTSIIYSLAVPSNHTDLKGIRITEHKNAFPLMDIHDHRLLFQLKNDGCKTCASFGHSPVHAIAEHPALTFITLYHGKESKIIIRRSLALH